MTVLAERHRYVQAKLETIGMNLLDDAYVFSHDALGAATVLWLCSPAATFVLGVALPVDGGYTTRWVPPHSCHGRLSPGRAAGAAH